MQFFKVQSSNTYRNNPLTPQGATSCGVLSGTHLYRPLPLHSGIQLSCNAPYSKSRATKKSAKILELKIIDVFEPWSNITKLGVVYDARNENGEHSPPNVFFLPIHGSTFMHD